MLGQRSGRGESFKVGNSAGENGMIGKSILKL